MEQGKQQRKRWTPLIDPSQNDIIRDLQKKYPHLSFKEIVTIVNSQFHFVKHCMKSGDFADFSTFVNPLLEGLGTFYGSEAKHKLVRSKILKQQDKNKDNNECTE